MKHKVKELRAQNLNRLLAHADTRYYARATDILLCHFEGADLLRIESFFYCGAMLKGKVKVYAFAGSPHNVKCYNFYITARDLKLGCLTFMEAA